MGWVAGQTHLLKDGREITIRSPSGDDAAAILALARRNFADSAYLLTEPDEFQMTVEQERAWIEGFAPAPNRVLLMAEFAGEPVGMLDVQGGHRRRIAHAGVLGMSVRSDFRGRGVGTRLMRAAIDWARSSCTITRLELLVYAANAPAIALYERCGFRQEGRKAAALRLGDGTYHDELLMGLLL